MSGPQSYLRSPMQPCRRSQPRTGEYMRSRMLSTGLTTEDPLTKGRPGPGKRVAHIAN